MSRKSAAANVATIGIDIGKNSFHVIGVDQRGAIVLKQKWTRLQIGRRLAAALSYRYGSLRWRPSSGTAGDRARPHRGAVLNGERSFQARIEPNAM